MKLFKVVLSAIFHLAFFLPYTSYKRWFEVGCGILFWVNLLLIIHNSLHFTPFLLISSLFLILSMVSIVQLYFLIKK